MGIDEYLAKASEGEGSRGGKVIGHTASGAPIYESQAKGMSPSQLKTAKMRLKLANMKAKNAAAKQKLADTQAGNEAKKKELAEIQAKTPSGMKAKAKELKEKIKQVNKEIAAIDRKNTQAERREGQSAKPTFTPDKPKPEVVTPEPKKEAAPKQEAKPESKPEPAAQPNNVERIATGMRRAAKGTKTKFTTDAGKSYQAEKVSGSATSKWQVTTEGEDPKLVSINDLISMAGIETDTTEAEKSMSAFDALEELTKAKYTKRTGSPGNYKYEYAGEDEKTDTSKFKLKPEGESGDSGGEKIPLPPGAKEHYTKVGDTNVTIFQGKHGWAWRIGGKSGGGSFKDLPDSASGSVEAATAHIQGELDKLPSAKPKLKKDAPVEIDRITDMPEGSGFGWKNKNWVVEAGGNVRSVDRSVTTTLKEIQSTAKENESKLWAKPTYFGKSEDAISAFDEFEALSKAYLSGGRIGSWADQFMGTPMEVDALQCVKDEMALDADWDKYYASEVGYRELEEKPRSAREAYRKKRDDERKKIEAKQQTIRKRMREMEKKLIDHRIDQAKAMNKSEDGSMDAFSELEALTKAKYIKRTGSPGNYKYEYPDDKAGKKAGKHMGTEKDRKAVFQTMMQIEQGQGPGGSPAFEEAKKLGYIKRNPNGNTYVTKKGKEAYRQMHNEFVGDEGATKPDAGLGDKKGKDEPKGTAAKEESKTGPMGLPMPQKTDLDVPDHNEHNVREMEVYADNTQAMYNAKKDFHKNLVRKIAAGKYDHKLAQKLWGYYADRAAQAYNKEHGSPGGSSFGPFSKKDRQAYAATLADEFLDEYNDSPEDFKQYVPKKYLKKSIDDYLFEDWFDQAWEDDMTPDEMFKAMPSGSPSMSRGPEDGDPLAEKGKQSGNHSGGSTADSDVETTSKTEKLSADDKPMGSIGSFGVGVDDFNKFYRSEDLSVSQITTMSRSQYAAQMRDADLRKAEQDVHVADIHPYAQAQAISSDDHADALLKSEDSFYPEGSPSLGRPQRLTEMSVLCKSGHEHAAYLTACPECGNGQVVHRTMPVEFAKSHGANPMWAGEANFPQRPDEVQDVHIDD